MTEIEIDSITEALENRGVEKDEIEEAILAQQAIAERQAQVKAKKFIVRTDANLSGYISMLKQLFLTITSRRISMLSRNLVTSYANHTPMRLF